MDVHDFRLRAPSIDENHFRHPAEEIRESTEDTEPNGLVVRVARFRVRVRQQRVRKVVQ